MSLFRRVTAATMRSVYRWARRALLAAVALAAAVVAGFTLYAVTALPDLEPWHTTRLPHEFTAGDDAPADFAGYAAAEAALFAAASVAAREWSDRGPAWAYSRFNPGSAVQRLAAGAPWNRSFRLTPARPVGGALLVHGLTDSPYSMKALAEVLAAQGLAVTVLRLPGHGTTPGMLARVDYADWVAAVRLAARDVAARTPAGQPFYVGGYSMGATLVLSYTLDSLTDPALRRPDRVLLLSPAITLNRLAPIANILDLLAVVPASVLQKVRWQSVEPEFDPYKFNSFPVNATRQVNRATRQLQAQLQAAAANGQTAALPPIVTWQSIVDATVGAAGTIDLLYGRLAGARHRLVLFDTNRSDRFGVLERAATRAPLLRVAGQTPPYTLDLVTNDGTGTAAVTIRRALPGRAPVTLATGLEWPATTVSLGHVALPFPADDPVYGYLPGSGHAGVPSLGALLLRGESGAIVFSVGSLTRPRSNPFWPLVAQQVTELVTADLAAGAP